MRPSLLAALCLPALVLTAAPAAALPVQGRVLGAQGSPLDAQVTLRRPGFAPDVAPLSSARTDGGAFALSAPGAGLYVLGVEAGGVPRRELPVLVGPEGLRDLDCRPLQEGALVASPRLAAWERIHREQAGRHVRAAKGGSVDWTQELAAVVAALAAEPDPATAALLAACYMDLGTLGANLDPRMMTRILERLPADSPYWSLNPRSMEDAINQLKAEPRMAFLQAMADRHGDPACRSTALLLRVVEDASEYDVEAWRRDYERLLREFPDSRLAKGASTYYDPAKAIAIGEPFPDFQLRDLEGRLLTLDSYKGKVLLVDFWATWCPPCVKDLPLLRELMTRYGTQGLAILSLSADRKPEVVTAFRKANPMPWDHAFLEGERRHPLPTRLSVSSIPRAFLVGRDGRILENRRSALRGEQLAATLEKAFARAPRS